MIQCLIMGLMSIDALLRYEKSLFNQFFEQEASSIAVQIESVSLEQRKRGVYRSTSTLLKIKRIMVDSLSQKISKAIELRLATAALNQLAASESSLHDLGEFLNNLVANLPAAINERLPYMGIELNRKRLDQELEYECIGLSTRVANGIDFIRNKRDAGLFLNQTITSASPVFNAPVGVVNMGTVNGDVNGMAVDSIDTKIEIVLRSLDSLARTIESDALLREHRRDIQALIDELKAEVQKKSSAQSIPMVYAIRGKLESFLKLSKTAIDVYKTFEPAIDAATEAARQAWNSGLAP